MPVKAIPKVAIPRNGLGAYIMPCHRITVQYCNNGGSSDGIRKVLANGQLNELAEKNRRIFFDIIKRNEHPRLKFFYNTNRTREIEIANMTPKEILGIIHEMAQASGNDLFKWNHKVISDNESVRGIWSPLHVAKRDRHQI